MNDPLWDTGRLLAPSAGAGCTVPVHALDLTMNGTAARLHGCSCGARLPRSAARRSTSGCSARRSARRSAARLHGCSAHTDIDERAVAERCGRRGRWWRPSCWARWFVWEVRAPRWRWTRRRCGASWRLTARKVRRVAPAVILTTPELTHSAANRCRILDRIHRRTYSPFLMMDISGSACRSILSA